MRGFLYLLALALVCSSAWAVNGDMGGADPNGSPEKPYLIEDVNDFDVFANPANAATYWASGVHTKLMTDIDLSGRTYTTAVIAPDTSTTQGFQGTPFTGVFDGSGYTFSNLTITVPTEYYIDIGLFGYVASGGQINYLGVINANVQGSDYIGGLVGTNSGTVTSCHTRGTVSGERTIGGLVGGNHGTISSCSATGSVISANNTVGGLCGQNFLNGTISRSYSASDVTGGTYAGGLCGLNIGAISDAYAVGSITGGGCVGGLCGYNYHNSATISSSYAAGNVTGDSNVGGLCGLNSGTISESFWDIDTSVNPTSAGGMGKTTTEMQTQSTFTGWDFSDVWFMSGYPVLAWQGDLGGGDGTQANPYLIENIVDFDKFCSDPNYWASGVHTKLMTDIDLAGRTYTTAVIAPDIPDVSVWTFDGIPFEGIFDGNDHTISNLAIDTNELDYDYLGLFGYIEGAGTEIRNLGIEEITIAGGSNSEDVGGLCGANYNVKITSCYAAGIVTGNDSVGGLCGRNNRGNITRCHSAGTISGDENIGGLLGTNHNGGIPKNCYSTCSVSGNIRIGGLVGNNLQTSIENCYTAGSVSGSNRIGGLCGENSGYVTNCNSLSSVTGSSFVGGLAGRNYGEISNCYASGSIINDLDGHFLGGLCGINHNDIINCYATGAVTGGDNSGALGGLCGGNYDSIINSYATGTVTAGANSVLLGGLCGGQDVEPYFSNCFWDVDTSGIGNSGDDYYGATGKSTSEMMTQSTFTGWDFSTPVWRVLRENEDYPRLAWQEVYLGDIAGLYGADMVDFAYLAQYWGLDCGTHDCGRADIDGSGDVGIGDLSYIAQDWLCW